MKKLTLALSLFLAGAAHAGTAEMVAQCEEVMRCDVCRVQLDTKVYTTETKLVINETGPVRIAMTDYNWIRQAGDSKLSDGSHLMCKRVGDAMSIPTSPRAIAAKALFSGSYDGRTYCPPARVALWDHVLAWLNPAHRS